MACAVYANSLGNGFTAEDLSWVGPVDAWSPSSVGGSPAAVAEPVPTGPARPPLTVASFVWQRGPADGPFDFHLVNMLLHAAVCVGVWWIVRDTGTPYGTPILTALLFAVHPLHTESVAHVAGRAGVLSALAMLGTWWLHRRAFRVEGGGSRLAGVAAAALYASALLASPMALFLPLVLWSDDRRRRFNATRVDLRSRDRRGRPRAVGSGVTDRRGSASANSLLARWPLQRWLGYAVALGGLTAARGLPTTWGWGRLSLGGANPLATAEATTRLLTALWLQVRYVGLALWPHPLVSDRGAATVLPVEGLGEPRAWAGMLFGAVCLGLWWWARRQAPLGSMLLTVWFATLLPASNLLIAGGSLMAERWGYLPLLAPCWGLAQLAMWCTLPNPALPWPRRLRVVAVVAGCLATLAALAVATVQRNPAWRTEERRVLTDVARAPRSIDLTLRAARLWTQRGELDAAEAALRRSLHWQPQGAATFRLAEFLLEWRPSAEDEAVRLLERAVADAEDVRNPEPFRRLAPLLERRGDTEGAGRAYRRAVELDPNDLAFRFQAGLHLLRHEDEPRALEWFRALAQDGRGKPSGEVAAGFVLELSGATEAARERYLALAQAPRLQPALRELLLERFERLQAGEDPAAAPTGAQ